MSNILAAVRPDHDTDWVARFLVEMYQREPIHVHLLSVRCPFNGHVRMFFDAALLREFHTEDAELEFAPVRRALDAAGVPYDTHVVVGYAAEEIVRFAQKRRCRRIVMGPPKGGSLSDLVLGSLNRQIEQMMRTTGKACEVL
jgi:nucleotide-binding universal stress UspA family protein